MNAKESSTQAPSLLANPDAQATAEPVLVDNTPASRAPLPWRKILIAVLVVCIIWLLFSLLFSDDSSNNASLSTLSTTSTENAKPATIKQPENTLSGLSEAPSNTSVPLHASSEEKSLASNPLAQLPNSQYRQPDEKHDSDVDLLTALIQSMD